MTGVITSLPAELQSLRTELEATNKRLDELIRALDFMDAERVTWTRAKRHAASNAPAPANDVTIGRGLPAAPVRTELNNIGGATI